MLHPTRIALLGLRCTGKTTLGKLLAERSGWSFLDMDDTISARVKMSIADIFRDKGEPFFRDQELVLLKEWKYKDRAVVACGGGAVVTPECRHILRDDFYSIWIQASPDVLAGRMKSDPKTASQRPNLTGAFTVEDEFRHLEKQRGRWYEEAARDNVKSPPDEGWIAKLVAEMRG